MPAGQSKLMKSVLGHSVGTLNMRNPGQNLGLGLSGMVIFSITGTEKLPNYN